MARINIAKEAGMKSEEYFSSLLRSEGLDYVFEDDWFDYLVNGHKVELKSCQITIKHYLNKNKEGQYVPGNRIGQFDFTNEENRERYIKENIWIALVIRHKNQFIMYGFIRANQLDGKRYLSIHKAKKLKPLDFVDWVKKIKREKQND